MSSEENLICWELVERNAINQCREWFYYGVKKGYEFEDMLQEAKLIFCRCKNNYSGKKDNKKHFMKYYKISLYNRLHDLFLRSYGKGNRFKWDGIDNCVSLEEYDPGDACFLGDFAIKLREAPKDIIKVLDIIFKAPEEMLEALGLTSKQKDRSKGFSVNKRLCEALDIDPNQISLKKELKLFLEL
jgi:hypothetical protein